MLKSCLLAWDCMTIHRWYHLQWEIFYFNYILAFLNIISPHFYFYFSLAWYHGTGCCLQQLASSSWAAYEGKLAGQTYRLFPSKQTNVERVSSSLPEISFGLFCRTPLSSNKDKTNFGLSVPRKGKKSRKYSFFFPQRSDPNIECMVLWHRLNCL